MLVIESIYTMADAIKARHAEIDELKNQLAAKNLQLKVAIEALEKIRKVSAIMGCDSNLFYDFSTEALKQMGVE